MKIKSAKALSVPSVHVSALAAAIGVLFISPVPALADVAFLGVAAGDASSAGATFWTRGVDPALPLGAALTLQVTTDPTFSVITNTYVCNTDPSKDHICKIDATGLAANTAYSYRFVGPVGELSIVGRIKTAPDAAASAPVHFAFSGDNDGLIRPYALATQLPAENLDFYINLGDVIYENASNLTTSGAHNGQPWLNSPSVTLSNSALNLNGVPVAGTTFATQAQLRADYAKKYRENFLPVNAGGQNSLQVLYAAQGNYTTWDNHELGNRKYIDGGAPAGGSVGGPLGTDMPTGRGVDARNNGAGNVGNVNDAADLLAPATLASLGGFMNRSQGFLALEDVFLNYQPIADRGVISAPSDPRTDGTRQLYSATQWGKNAIYINLDGRTYRDLRLKTPTANADETTAPRANNPGRTLLGATQLAWLKQILLAAQAAGTPWKFISVDDPIDQIGPIGGALTLSNLPSFGTGSTYAPVNADGGKSYIGGYRAERNDLLKFIADNHITNVVFMSTDDHQNRINELTYSPTGQTEVQSSYVKVPYAFSIVAGPLGATGPDLITNHTFTMAQQLANSLVAAQQAAGVEPFGLIGYPGLHDLVRDGDPTAGTAPQPVDFYSPDTFNFTVFDVSADGKTLTVRSRGMDATAQNAGIEYANGPQARDIFSFQIDALPVTRGSLALDRRLGKMVQQLTITNNTGADLTGPIDVVLSGLSGNTSLANASGTTVTTAPGSPYITVQAGTLAVGASATVALQFVRPVSGSISYTTVAVAGNPTP
jgi:phosphodiesterase/alkaline phosphatase D-like protein